MGKFHRLRLTSDKIGAAHGTKILLDDQQLHGVRFIRLTGEIHDVWRCEIEFLPGALDVQLQALVRNSPDIVTSGSVVPPEPLPTLPGHEPLEDGPFEVVSKDDQFPSVLDIGNPPEGG